MSIYFLLARFLSGHCLFLAKPLSLRDTSPFTGCNATFIGELFLIPVNFTTHSLTVASSIFVFALWFSTTFSLAEYSGTSINGTLSFVECADSPINSFIVGCAVNFIRGYCCFALCDVSFVGGPFLFT